MHLSKKKPQAFFLLYTLRYLQQNIIIPRLWSDASLSASSLLHLTGVIAMSTTTRAAARQQEQGNQLSRLLALVEDQIKRLDEVAEEQKRQRRTDGGAAGDCSLSNPA